MLLSDQDIDDRVQSGELLIKPYDPARLQPASYDCTLAPVLLVPQAQHGRYYDLVSGGGPCAPDHMRVEFDMYPILPGEFVLGATVEQFRFGDLTAGLFDGRSSLGRMGLSVHATAGFFDPGFEGTATLELKNDGMVPIMLRPHVAIGQMFILPVSSRSLRSYRDLGAYNGQKDPTPPRFRP